MKVHLTFEFTDLARQTVRSADGRSGKATRAELRGFAIGAVYRALHELPPPKQRRRKAAAEPAPAPAAKTIRGIASTPAGARAQRNLIAQRYHHTVATGPLKAEEN